MIRATRTRGGEPAESFACTGSSGFGRCEGPPIMVFLEDDGRFTGRAACSNGHHIAKVDAWFGIGFVPSVLPPPSPGDRRYLSRESLGLPGAGFVTIDDRHLRLTDVAA